MVIPRPVWKRNQVSLQKPPLRHSRVLDLRLVHKNGVIVQVVHDHDLPHSVVLLSHLVNSLLEVSVKPQDLAVVLQPLRRLLGNGNPVGRVQVFPFIRERDSRLLEVLD